MSSQPADRAVAAEILRAAVVAMIGLPLKDVEQVRVLVAAGELQVALETLCTQVYEYDVEVSTTQREALQALGDMLDVSVSYLLGDPWAEPRTAKRRDDSSSVELKWRVWIPKKRRP